MRSSYPGLERHRPPASGLFLPSRLFCYFGILSPEFWFFATRVSAAVRRRARKRDPVRSGPREVVVMISAFCSVFLHLFCSLVCLGVESWAGMLPGFVGSPSTLSWGGGVVSFSKCARSSLHYANIRVTAALWAIAEGKIWTFFYLDDYIVLLSGQRRPTMRLLAYQHLLRRSLGRTDH